MSATSNRVGPVLAVFLATTLFGCSWTTNGGSDASVDDGNNDCVFLGEPVHQGLNQSNDKGALRLSYGAIPFLGFDFSGDDAVYADVNAQLFYIDIKSELEWRLCTSIPKDGGGSGSRIYPAVSNGIIIARGYNKLSEPVALFLYDLQKGKQYKPNLPFFEPNYPRADGNRVVYLDRRYWNELGGQNTEIFLYDLETGVETRLTTQPMIQTFPAISGDRVVWEDYRKGHFCEEIVLHDLATREYRNLTDDLIRQFSPNIDGDLIVWTDLRNGESRSDGSYTNADVYLYRISTGELTQITTDPSDQEYPFINGKYIGWTDLRHGKRTSSGMYEVSNVFVYNLETGEEKQVTFSTTHSECCPVIRKDKLVYQSYDINTGKGALWLLDLKKYWP